MESTVQVGNVLITPPLTENQFSVAHIPALVYKWLVARYGIMGETSHKYSEQSTRFCELRGDNTKDTVFALFSEEPDGEAIRTKFALLSGRPSVPQYREFYEFEINGNLSSGGWSHGRGNEYTEVLTFSTRDTVRGLPVGHLLTFYAAKAMIEAREILLFHNPVIQKYIDHAPKPPR